MRLFADSLVAGAGSGTAALGAVAGVACWIGVCVGAAGVVGQRRVTPATWITIGRGTLGAALLGWAFFPSGGTAAWLSALLFASAGLLDAVDGPIARRTETVSELGARLDTEADGLVVLVGSILVVTAGLAPDWFLAVGAARYLYVAGCWFRRTRGNGIGEDDAELLPAAIYAGTMTAIWVALLPVTEPGLTNPLLTVAGVLLLGSFLRSWLVVTGRVSGRRRLER